MSSKANKIKENVEKKEQGEIALLYTTLLGTIIATVGLLNKVDQKEQLKYFKSCVEHKDLLPNTVKGLCDYVWTSFGKVENIPLRANIVLLTDEENKRSPMVTFIFNDEVMPLAPNGFAVGLIGLAREGRPNVEAEYIYDEDGMDYVDAEVEEIE